MDAMKPKGNEDEDNIEESGTMLNETEQFIEKIDAVEKDRKESQSSVTASSTGVEIHVQRPSISEETEDVNDEDAFANEEAVIAESKVPDEDTISIFAGIGEDSKVEYEAGERVSEYSLYKKVGDDDDDILGNYQIVDQGVIVSKKNEDNISVMSFSVHDDGDNVSLSSITLAKEADNIDEEDQEEEDDDDGDSVKTLTEGEKSDKHLREDVTKTVIYTNGDVHDDKDDIAVHPDDEDDEVEVNQFQNGLPNSKAEEDSVSIKSYSIHGDYILSLHQRLNPDGSPVPKPRTKEPVAVDPKTDTVVAKSVLFKDEDMNGEDEEVTSPNTFTSSYEDERSKLDFETIVKESMDKYKSEKKKSGYLEEIEREEGEDRPNIAALLAWAKATKADNTNKTKTFVIKKQRKEEQEEVLKQSLDYTNNDNFEVIIQEKSQVTTQEEDNGVTKIKTGKKTFEVQSKASTFEVRKKSVIHPSTNITKDWFENAIKQHEGVANCSIINMDFNPATNGTYNAVIEANVGGEVNTYSWIIKETPKASQASFDKDTFVITDLGLKLKRFLSSSSSKLPLSVPFPPVIYSDAQFTILPDVSSFKYHDSNIALDEIHMKVGVRALARLHAISYAYFNRSSDNVQDFSAMLKVLVDHHYQPTASSQDKDEARAALEAVFDNLIKVLEQNSADTSVIERSKTLRSMMFKLYKEARQSSSTFSVLCHGQPTLDNILFLYDDKGTPVDAKFVNFSNCRIATPMSDFLVFTNSNAADQSREDFMLRFVYYENLVSTLKQLGVKNDIIDYDGIKLEKQKQTLYGLIEAASLLLTSSDSASLTKKSPVPSHPVKAKRIQSKILGDFSPRDSSSSLTNGHDDVNENIGDRIVELMERATVANTTRKVNSF